MKKILTTLTVIAATALGAQGQSTITFPNTPTNVSFSGLTFEQVTANVPGSDSFDRVRLLFGVTGVANNDIAKFSITDITLSGQGITGSKAFIDSFGDPDTVALSRPSRDVPNLDRFNYSITLLLDTPIQSWNSVNNLVSFNMDVLTTVPPGARVYYGVQYAFGTTQVNTAFGNVNLVAVPEPSTYFAAAGLLGLCLWSARRHLFKFAGSRSATSNAGGNGAA